MARGCCCGSVEPAEPILGPDEPEAIVRGAAAPGVGRERRGGEEVDLDEGFFNRTKKDERKKRKARNGVRLPGRAERPGPPGLKGKEAQRSWIQVGEPWCGRKTWQSLRRENLETWAPRPRCFFLLVQAGETGWPTPPRPAFAMFIFGRPSSQLQRPRFELAMPRRCGCGNSDPTA